MALLVIYLFMVFAGIIVAIYLLVTNGKPVWAGHTVDPRRVPEQKSRIDEVTPETLTWTPESIAKELDEVKQKIYQADSNRQKPSRSESLQGFFPYAVYAWGLMWKEKEIFTFALLQWVVIGAGYYLWVQILGWIPASLLESAGESEGVSIVDIVVSIWSFLCVGLVSYFLGILTSCMGAVHFIRRQGRSSSIAECLRLVLPRVWPIWIFTWIDSWITVDQILERLPKRNDRTPAATKLMKEALYYAWKIGTIGILPGLITGRGFVESCRKSMDIVETKFKDVAKLRLGYSALCWVVGISAYVGMVIFVCACQDLLPPVGKESFSRVYVFYVLAGLPLLFAVGVVQIILRPVYVIASCHIYSDYLNEKGETIMLPRPPSRGYSALVSVIVLMVFLATVFLYRDQLGITEMLATKYGVILDDFEAGNSTSLFKEFVDVPSRLRVGADAFGDGIVDIAIKPPEEFDFKTTGVIMGMRMRAVNAYRQLVDGEYHPYHEPFGRIMGGRAWWGVSGDLCQGPGPRSNAGASKESQFILNPFLLLGLDPYIAVPLRRAYSCFSVYSHPVSMSWDARNARAEVVYNISSDFRDQEHMAKALKATNNYLFYLLDYNARDFGYSYIHMSRDLSRGVGPVDGSFLFKEAVPLQSFIHWTQECGHSTGCNHKSNGQPQLLLSLGLPPAVLHCKLWKVRPADVSEPADFTYVLRFN